MEDTRVLSLGQEDALVKEWLPTPVLLLGEFHRQRSLVGYNPWVHKESDTTEQITLSLLIILEFFHTHQSPFSPTWWAALAITGTPPKRSPLLATSPAHQPTHNNHSKPQQEGMWHPHDGYFRSTWLLRPGGCATEPPQTLSNISSVQFSRSVMSDSLWPHESQHARPPCPSPTPRVHPNPCPLSWSCHPPSHPLSSPSPPAPNPSQHQGLFQRVSSSNQVAKVLEFQLQHQSFQWTPRTDLL